MSPADETAKTGEADEAGGDAVALHRGGLTNRAAVRRFVLEYAQATGRGPVIRRVGHSVAVSCDMTVRKHLRQLVRQHPSGFRTLEA